MIDIVKRRLRSIRHAFRLAVIEYGDLLAENIAKEAVKAGKAQPKRFQKPTDPHALDSVSIDRERAVKARST
jgi:hypothetical protein